MTSSSTKDLVERLEREAVLSDHQGDVIMRKHAVMLRESASALTAAQARIAELEAKLVGVMDAWEHDQAKAKIALDQRDTAERERDEARAECNKEYTLRHQAERERDEALETLKMVREIGLADEDGAATVESVIERVLRTSPSASAVDDETRLATAERERDEARAKRDDLSNRLAAWIERAGAAERERDEARAECNKEYTLRHRVETERDEARAALKEAVDHDCLDGDPEVLAKARAVLGGDQTGATKGKP